MNLDFYGLFDYTSSDGDTYEYTASEFNTILKAITGNGVVKGQANEMAVSVNELSVTVDTGIAFAEGRIGQIKSAKTITLDAPTTNRTDSIVIRVDVANRTVSLNVLKGSTTLTQTELVYEILLAEIAVSSSGTNVVTDKRTFVYMPKQVMDKMNGITSGTDTVYARYA